MAKNNSKMNYGNEEVKLRMELQIPSVQIQNYLALHNEKIEQQVKAGIDNAIEKLSNGNILADMVEQEVLSTIVKAVGSTVTNYESVKNMRKLIENGIYDSVEKYAEKIIDQVNSKLNGNDQ